MTQMPLISLIIPAYNVEKYLDNCLGSVTAQTYGNLEIILVDDGSKDTSGAICDRWAERDDRIQVIHKKNGGLSSARNAGLDRAKGEFIMFVDGDDLLHRQICEQLYQCLSSAGADIAICNPAHIFDTAQIPYTVSEQRQVMSAPEAIREMWYQHSFLPSAWGKLYRSRILENIRFAEGCLYEDIDLMHELFWQADRIVYNPSALYGYVHRENSITTWGFSLRDAYILDVADKILAFAGEKDKSLLPAAQSYSMVAALRVELNAANTAELEATHARARQLLQKYGRTVLKDKNIRRKNRLALLMYFYFRPLMPMVYKHVNRWK